MTATLLGGAVAGVAMWRSNHGDPTPLWAAVPVVLGTVGLLHPDALWVFERLELSMTMKNWREAEPSRVWRGLTRAGGVTLLGLTAWALLAPDPEPVADPPEGVRCPQGICWFQATTPPPMP